MIMAFVFFMFGLAMLLFGTAWGLVTIGAATPVVMAASLLIAGIAISHVWRFGVGNNETEGRRKWMHDRQLFDRRRPHHAHATSSHWSTQNLR
jgi:hypothetical protein